MFERLSVYLYNFLDSSSTPNLAAISWLSKKNEADLSEVLFATLIKTIYVDVRICPDLVTTDLRMENKGFIIVSKTNVENDDIIVVATGVNFFGKFNIRTMNYVKKTVLYRKSIQDIILMVCQVWDNL